MMIGTKASIQAFLLILISATTVSYSALHREIKIGVLIRHRGLEEPLNRTLESLNADTSTWPSTRLVAVIEIVEIDNSYQTSSASKYFIDLNAIYTLSGPRLNVLQFAGLFLKEFGP